MKLLSLFMVFVLALSLRVDASPACHPVLVNLAKHIGLGGFPRPERKRVISIGRLLHEVLKEADPELEAILDRLLKHIPHKQASGVVLRLGKEEAYSQQLRLAVIHRLRRLHAEGDEKALDAGIDLIAQMDESVSTILNTQRHQFKELEPAILAASKQAMQNPESFMAHIRGSIDLTDATRMPRCPGGAHTLEYWNQIREDRIQALPELGRQGMADWTQRIDMQDEGIKLVSEFLQDIGLTHDRRGVAIEMTTEGMLWSVEKRANGAVGLWVPRHVLTPRAWRSTEVSARYGTSPVGGKSLFPKDWTEADILKSIQSVVNDRESLVIRRSAKSSTQQSFYLKGKYRDVWVEVGITAGRVGTGFPTWRQYSPDTVRQAYLEWWNSRDRLRDTGALINRQAIIPTDLISQEQLVDLYLGRNPSGLTESEIAELKPWLNPAHLSENHPNVRVARSYQSVIFDYIQRTRILRELENATKVSPSGE